MGLLARKLDRIGWALMWCPADIPLWLFKLNARWGPYRWGASLCSRRWLMYDEYSLARVIRFNLRNGILYRHPPPGPHTFWVRLEHLAADHNWMRLSDYAAWRSQL